MVVVGASAYSRIIDFARMGEIAVVGAMLFVDMAHIAGLVAAGIHPSPVPTPFCVHHDTQDPARAARRAALFAEKYAADLDHSFPGIQGGPLMHVIAAKAVCLKEAMELGFVDYQKQVVANAKALAAAVARRGFRIVSGGTDNHLFLVEIHSRGITGSVANLPSIAPASPSTKRHPLLLAASHEGWWNPRWTRRDYSRRHARTRMGTDRRMARRGAEPTGDAAVEQRVHSEVMALTKKFPLYKPHRLEEAKSLLAGSTAAR